VSYCGGGIIREAMLQAAGGRVLNAHAGPLPAVRGMNAVEWSILLGRKPCVTIHYIDAGIDTGPPIGIEEPIPVEPGDTVDILRDKALVASIKGLRKAASGLGEDVPSPRPDAGSAKQFYVMHPLLKDILERRLRRPAGPRL
jgi:phosphoribosylglycinamide formyltransferase-1